MNEKNKLLRSLVSSVTALAICVSMFAGTTMAWFTDTATTNVQNIVSGTLDVDIVDDTQTATSLVGKSLGFKKADDSTEILWEPNCTYELDNFYIVNKGKLAFKYKIVINGVEGNSELLDVITFTVKHGDEEVDLDKFEGHLTAKGTTKDKSELIKITAHMDENAGNAYQGKTLSNVSITVYATQDTVEYDSYGNTYDAGATYGVDLSQAAMLMAGEESIEFVFDNVAKLEIPADAIADTSKAVTVTIKSIDPADSMTLGEHQKAFAYDIDVTNLKEGIADDAIKVLLYAPIALPAAQVYHSGELVDNSLYDEVTGSITFKTGSFSPFAVSYLEYEASTIDELREYTAIDNAYVKLTADIDAQLNKEIDGNVCDYAHSHLSSSFSNNEGRCYFLVKIGGVNVTLDLNGHTIATYDSLNGESGKEWCGGTFYISSGASLNITDTAGGGKVKAMGPHYIVWANYWSDEAWCDIYGGIFMSDSYVGDKLGYGYPYNCAMIYSGYDDSSIGCINVYGGYYLYNNFNNNANIGSFNVGDSATTIGITVHDGVMLINEWYRQRTGTDDDAITLAEGCELTKVTLDTPVVIDGVEYATWYQVQTTKPTFETVFENTDTYLYRVGNSNTIKLGSLFQATNPNSVVAANATIDVKIESMDSTTSVAGTYTKASTTADWANGTIKFTGTGPAKITINGCELLVEVVDGKNVTAATEIGSSSNVLLNDIALSSSKTSIGVGSNTLYGNGFTIDFAGYGKHSANTSGVITVSGGTIDNVKIIGDTYTTFTDSSTDEWYAAAVYATGASKITNSYIHGCQVALRVQGSSCAVENTTLSGGRYANLQLKQGTLTLKDVTTVQEKVVVNGTTYLGFGINVWEDAPAGTKIVVDGDLTQYNWVTANDKSYLPGTAANYVTTAFEYNQFVYTYNGTKYVNLGIISISSDVLSSAIEVPNGYSAQDVQSKACVVTNDNTKNSTLLDSGVPAYDGWSATEQGAIKPTYTWTYPSEYNSSSKEIVVSFTEGESYTINPNFMTATKNGQSLNVAVSMDGTDYTGKEITFTQSGDHTLTYMVTDPYNYDAATDKSNATYTFTIGVSAVAKAPEAAHAEFTYTAGQAATVVEIGGKKYVMPNVSATSDKIYSTTVSGTTVYMPIVEVVYKNNSSDFYGYAPIFTAINIKDYAGGLPTGAITTYNESSTSVPTNWGKSSGSPYISGAASTKANPVSYSTYGLCYESKKGADINASAATVLFYYTDNAGETYYYYIRYSFPAHTCPSTCFTPDTLVTLSDGTQKRVDELSFEDKILAWDFFTSSYVEKDISLLVNHGADKYDVVYTEYSDGTILKTIGEHGVFDYEQNKFVYITAKNVNDYIGHRFVKQNINGGYDIVTMTEGYVNSEYVEAWSVSSAETSNVFASGLLTVAPPEDFYNWIEMDGNLHYDVEQFAKDVETYGLYTYEDFKDYVTYEQFVDWNGAYLKIPVEKGYFTFDYILELIEMYKGWMPQN